MMKQLAFVISICSLLLFACKKDNRSDADRAQILYNECIQYQNVGDLPSAEGKITEAIGLKSDPLYFRKRVGLYLTQNKYDKAYEDLIFLRDSSVLEDHDVSNLIKVAYVLGHNDESLSYCDQRIKKNKYDFYSLFYRAVNNQQLFKYKEALADLDHIIAHSPDEYYVAYLERGNIHATLGFREEALDDYLKYIDYADNDNVAYLNIGLLYFNMGRPDDALKYYKEALRRKETEVGLQSMALYYGDRGDFLRALEYYNLATDKNDKSLASYLAKGEIFLKLAKKQEAKAAFAKTERLATRLLETKKDDATVYLVRGNAYKHLGEEEKAEEDYHLADSLYTLLIEEYPEAPRLYRMRGEVSMERGDFEKAYADLDKSFRMDTLFLYTKKLRDRAKANLL